jgi:2-amino-4-hydroxy-6-hydroxymethyldihydropteridine diphosphokinase
MNRVTAFLGLGSNMGDSVSTLMQAVRTLNQCPSISVVHMSSLIQTSAQGPDGALITQPDYINGVCQIQTSQSPLELLQTTQQIEIQYGRLSKGDGQSRSLDIDILLFGDLCVEMSALTIPHRLMHMRDFVLFPMCEIAPDVVHPRFQKTMQTLRDTYLKCHVSRISNVLDQAHIYASLSVDYNTV